MNIGDSGAIDTVAYCLTVNTLGSANTSPIIGQVGTAFPSINLTGGNLPLNTAASFLPSGALTPIIGKIDASGNFVPNAGQTITLSMTLGSSTGVLSSAGITSLNVPTNFTSAPVVSSSSLVVSSSSPIASYSATR